MFFLQVLQNPVAITALGVFQIDLREAWDSATGFDAAHWGAAAALSAVQGSSGGDGFAGGSGCEQLGGERC